MTETERDAQRCRSFGVDARARFPDGVWSEIAPGLGLDWYRVRGDSRLEWRHAAPFVRMGFEASAR